MRKEVENTGDKFPWRNYEKFGIWQSNIPERNLIRIGNWD
jgi:hypothetical protein